MRNHFEGETLYLLGNGKSLNDHDLELLADKHTMCFNRFYLKDVSWYPTIYTVADEAIIQDYAAEINKYIKHVEYPFFPAMHPAGIDFADYISGAWYELRWGGHFLKSKKLLFGLNGTVASVGLQLAYWLGFKTIYLMGVDMDYVIPENTIHVDDRNLISGGLDPNHFDTNYFGSGHRYHVPQVDLSLKQLNKLTYQMRQKGVRVINLNPDSRFTGCEFGEYERVLEHE